MKYRTEVLHSAAELIPRCWDERLLGASDFYLSTKWLTATELLNDIHPNYIVALDQAGEVIAGLVAFLFDSRTPPWEFYRIDCVLNRLLKKPDHLSRGIANGSETDFATLLPTLFLGGRHVGHGRLLLAQELTASVRGDAMNSVLDCAEELAGSGEARSVGFMFVDEGDELCECLEKRAYHQLRNAGAGIMEIDFPSFDEYLKRFSGHRRRNITKELRQFDEAGIVFSERSLDEVSQEISTLEAQLEQKYGISNPVEVIQKKHAVVSDLFPTSTVVLTAELHGRICGFVLAIKWRDSIFLRQAGFDYEMNGKLPIYFGVAFYEAVKYALNVSAKRIFYAIESTEAKSSRGCRIVEQKVWVRGLDVAAVKTLQSILGTAAVMVD